MSSGCPPQSQQPDSESFGALSSCGARLGLTFVAQSACLSFIAVVSLLTYVSYLAFLNRNTPGWRLIRSHLDLYLLGLLVSDLIQAIGGIMDVKWISMASVRKGGFCTAQGVLEQFGDVGVALCSLAIAAHTFAELFLRWKEPRSFLIPITVLSLYVVFLTLIVGVGYAVHRHDDYYGETTYWCWITPKFLDEGIGLEYLWLWIAALANLVLYIPVFLALKGVIIVEASQRSRWSRYHVRRTTPEEKQVMHDEKHLINPRRMLLYPAVYIITVLPIAVTRISSLAHMNHKVPFPATIFSGVLFSASGLFNVIVYTSTRPALLRPSGATLQAPPVSQRSDRAPQLFWSEADQIDTDTPDASGFHGSSHVDSVPHDDLPSPKEQRDQRLDIPSTESHRIRHL